MPKSESVAWNTITSMLNETIPMPENFRKRVLVMWSMANGRSGFTWIC